LLQRIEWQPEIIRKCTYNKAIVCYSLGAEMFIALYMGFMAILA